MLTAVPDPMRAQRDAGRVAQLEQPDFRLGPVTISPATRTLSGPVGQAAIEPQMMTVLLCLAERPGELVSRARLLDRCWGAPVGDDSLNRAIAGIRRAARAAAGNALRIETIARSGYLLAAPASGMADGRAGAADPPALAALRQALAAEPLPADALAAITLLLRAAAGPHGPATRRIAPAAARRRPARRWQGLRPRRPVVAP